MTLLYTMDAYFNRLTFIIYIFFDVSVELVDGSEICCGLHLNSWLCAL